MLRTFFQNTKYVSIAILFFALATFTVPQAFAGIPAIATDVIISSITAFPSYIEIFCTAPLDSFGVPIPSTGNLLQIDDSILFNSIDVETSGLICDGFSLNTISTAFLTDLTTYNVRLTVSTVIPEDSIATASFVQPDARSEE